MRNHSSVVSVIVQQLVGFLTDSHKRSLTSTTSLERSILLKSHSAAISVDIRHQRRIASQAHTIKMQWKQTPAWLNDKTEEFHS